MKFLRIGSIFIQIEMSALRNRYVLWAPMKSINSPRCLQSFRTSFKSLSTTVILSESQFHTESDNCLEKIVSVLESFDEKFPIDDLNFEQGVLTINLGSKGTWIINKQTPNRQIWWSSPVSGPKRYEFKSNSWLSTRDGGNIIEDLVHEMSTVSGVIVSFK